MLTPSSRTKTAIHTDSPRLLRRRSSATEASAISSTEAAIAFATHPPCPWFWATCTTWVKETLNDAVPRISATVFATRASPRRGPAGAVAGVVTVFGPLIR